MFTIIRFVLIITIYYAENIPFLLDLADTFCSIARKKNTILFSEIIVIPHKINGLSEIFKLNTQYLYMP